MHLVWSLVRSLVRVRGVYGFSARQKGRRWSPPGTLDGPGRCGGGEWVQGLTEGRSEDALGAWSIGRVRDGHNQAPPTALPHLPPPPGNSSQRKPDLAGS